ncbi:aspartate--tRNA ligase [Breznakiella homolactica]|uniref:Aspartate--tRNA(Asp/Asn) ligase n=1 Tax=Breznakiella homolactica TaxID=2798577 RepID=A0A7T7XN95_9SPIR|nr:aspartate--tRNA ligase [Breznakiella homolactica]QQO09479.1 aspartate--tRNA ligase [Breznakiella homolactica]
MKRTVNCGVLRAADAGKNVVLNGWVHRKRDHGGISFINLRDRYGITQVVVDQDSPSDLVSTAEELRNEYCIAVEGIVRTRPETMVNPDMETGEVEVVVKKLVILSRCEVLPFQIDEESEAKEELRLKYRYLDLRSGGMQRRIKLRNDVMFAVREWMIEHGFFEIETPTFIKSTPEGARDYLVPSRLYPGKFYALPQSPQLYKQLLMVSGFDKYFQIARCYRDEDARGDRQPEFTQIDIEMSFVSRDDVLSMTEGLFQHVFRKTLGVNLPEQFRRLTYDDALEIYGTDKPDLRFDIQLQDFAAFVENSDFQAFKDALAQGAAEQSAAALKGVTISGGGVKALVVPGKADYSRKQIEELEAHAKIYKAKGLAWMKVAGSAANPILEGGISKFFGDRATEITSGLGAKPGDLILIVADSRRRTANIALGAVRSKIGKDLGLCDPDRFEFAWIVDFPMFEFNEEENRWEAAHHMFSWPQEKYHATLEQDPGAVKGDLYDLVLNGYELASGSIRIHDPELQKRIFSIVGFNPIEAEKKFGFLIEAFKYGAPPHGGIAPGLDRLIMLMAGETSIKEVIAFPKNSFAVSPMDECPSEVDQKQLDELHLSIRYPQEGN